MKYLLYGIMRQDDSPWHSPEPGLCRLSSNGLAAAASPLAGDTPEASVSALMAYEKVVEGIHARHTIIPLRYGCAMECESAVTRLLDDHHEEYDALLGRLLGMTEMGIRVLWPARSEVVPASPSSPGATYLASLRNRYGSAVALAPEEAQLADRIVSVLSGCSKDQRREVSSSNHGHMVSLYFLTPTTCAEEFRQQARLIRPPSGAKLLLSGPWPPYNFVVFSG
jgi:hypothetical protein